MRSERRIFLETGATHLSFGEPHRRRRWPLLLAILSLGALGLGFAAYIDQPQDLLPDVAALPADDSARPVIERTPVEIPGAGITPPPAETDAPAVVLAAATVSPFLPDVEPAQALADPPAGALQQAGTDDQPDATAHEDLAADTEHLEWTEYVVTSGDSLSRIFSRLEIHGHLQEVLALGDTSRELQRLFPGERLRAGTRDGRLEALIYEPRGDHYVEIMRCPDKGELVAERHDHELETRQQVTHAEIQQSLFLDGSRAGLSDAMLIQIADIFGWDIDFAWDIRQGDRLIVVYDRIYRDGEYLRDGPVLAAEFHNRGRTLKALRFAPDGEPADYYNPEGQSMRQAFIRTPVDVGRISSHFGPRKHPVLGYTRQHQGVDYAAPTGTPIRAAGNGRITHRGTRGGYGKTVIIDHGNHYKTLYAHMSNYRSGQSVGSRVRQGEVIGYVGMSGLATGPHLHYEFHVRDKAVNPVKVELPRAESLAPKHMEAFRRATAPVLAAIEAVRETQMAEGATGAGSF